MYHSGAWIQVFGKRNKIPHVFFSTLEFILLYCGIVSTAFLQVNSNINKKQNRMKEDKNNYHSYIYITIDRYSLFSMFIGSNSALVTFLLFTPCYKLISFSLVLTTTFPVPFIGFLLWHCLYDARSENFLLFVSENERSAMCILSSVKELCLCV